MHAAYDGHRLFVSDHLFYTEFLRGFFFYPCGSADQISRINSFELVHPSAVVRSHADIIDMSLFMSSARLCSVYIIFGGSSPHALIQLYTLLYR